MASDPPPPGAPADDLDENLDDENRPAPRLRVARGYAMWEMEARARKEGVPFSRRRVRRLVQGGREEKDDEVGQRVGEVGHRGRDRGHERGAPLL